MTGVAGRSRSRGIHWAEWSGLAILLVLGGCSSKEHFYAHAPVPAVASPASAAIPSDNTKLAYRHDLQLEMPVASVKPHYDRAVDRCIKDAKLGCVVLKTSFNTGEQYGTTRPNAMVTVRLAHDAVAPFEADLLAPLPGETAGDAILRSRSTTAEDLAAAIADVERRQAQLTDYRDRLMELAKRPDVKVEDLIKIESEISSTQSQLEAIAAQKKTLDQRVDTEIVSVIFGSRDTSGNFLSPIVQSWSQASGVLGESTGSAMRFFVAAVPWLPIIALVLFLGRIVFRRWRR